jgi:hypothetical protein
MQRSSSIGGWLGIGGAVVPPAEWLLLAHGKSSHRSAAAIAFKQDEPFRGRALPIDTECFLRRCICRAAYFLLVGYGRAVQTFEVGPRIVVGPEARWAYATAVCLTTFPCDRKTLNSRSEGVGSFGLIRVPTTSRRHAR